MKYMSVLESNAVKTTMSIACGKCGKRLDGSEKFCPECGRELERKPKTIANLVLAKILDAHVLEVEKVGEPTASSRRCDHGNGKPETCGHILPSGACDVCFYPSNPPQYKMCPFRGDGFIKFQDAYKE